MGIINIFISINAFLGNVKRDSCEQGQCYCFDNRITCIDMIGPKFRYRINVNFLHMVQVQILDFDSIFKKLPNLKHLTMMNMRYFRCELLKNIPSGINVHTNMCVSYSTYSKTTSYMTSTGEFSF